jgi:hypothetical protein
MVSPRSWRLSAIAFLALVLLSALASGPGFCDDETDRDCQVCHLRHLPLLGSDAAPQMLAVLLSLGQISFDELTARHRPLVAAGLTRAPPA